MASRVLGRVDAGVGALEDVEGFFVMSADMADANAEDPELGIAGFLSPAIVVWELA